MRRKQLFHIMLTLILTLAVFLLPILNSGEINNNEQSSTSRSSFIISDSKHEENYGSELNVPKSDERVTFIVITDGDPLVNTVINSAGKYHNVSELLLSGESKPYTDAIKKNQAVVRASIKKMIKDSDFDGCFRYSALINGFTVNAPYSELERLSKINGVRQVLLSSSQSRIISELPDQTDDAEALPSSSPDSENKNTDKLQNESDIIETDTRSFSDLNVTETGADVLHSSGITGKGKLIAFIDDGFNCEHSSFRTEPPQGRYNSALISTIAQASPFNTDQNAQLYHSGKIVFSYDYAGRDIGTLSDSSHGTHTASLAAGCGADDTVLGIAPDSQLMLMKVCPDSSDSASDDVILAALDDCARLSPDILNISMGVPRTSSNAELFTDALEKLYITGTLICSSAGNNSVNLIESHEDGISADYTDYGTVSYPSSLPFVISSGSYDSKRVSPYVTFNGAFKADITQINNSFYTYYPDELSFPEVEYTFVPGQGLDPDYQDIDVSGKVAVVKQDGIPFSDKINSASLAGACGLLVISNSELYYTYYSEASSIPAFCINESAGKYISEHPSGKLILSDDPDLFTPSSYKSPSDFTSYGPSPDLTLKPDVIAPGTDILSSDNSGTSSFSGTSASSAITAGCAALVLETLEDKNISFSEKNIIATSVLMNSSYQAKNKNSVIFSPRLQGAGCIDLSTASSVHAVATSTEGKVSSFSGDNKDGIYTVSMTLRSLVDEPVTYKLSSDVQTDGYEIRNGININSLSPVSITDNSSVQFFSDNKQINEITLDPWDSVGLEMRLTLNYETIASLMMLAPSGAFIEGYVYFSPDDNSTSIHLPYCGYFGSWTNNAVFDSTIYDDKSAIVREGAVVAVDISDSQISSFRLGQKIINSDYYSEHICIGHNTVRNFMDNSSSGSSFLLPDLSLLRDAEDFTMSITDSNGSELYSINTGRISAFAGAELQPFEVLLSSFNSDSLKNFFSSLPEGRYNFNVKASPISVNSDSSSVEPQAMTFSFTVDNTSPAAEPPQTYLENGKIYLRLKASDSNGISGFVLYSTTENAGKYSYADRIDKLIENGFISEDCCTLVSCEETETEMCCIYDITQLCKELMRLGAYSSGTSEHNYHLKFYYSAADYAFNLSAPLIGDSTVSGKAVIDVSDQNGKPVKGAVISINSLSAETDENGKAMFDGLYPDIYIAEMTSLPESYSGKTEPVLFVTSLDNINFSHSFTVKALSESSESSKSEESSSESSEVRTSADEKQERIQPAEKPLKKAQPIDDSGFSVVFVSSLLIICIVSLAIRKKRIK